LRLTAEVLTTSPKVLSCQFGFRSGETCTLVGYPAMLSRECVSQMGEVAGIVLIPAKDAGRLLKQSALPIASALRCSLPKCVEWLGFHQPARVS
jgi:hypothetical protein